MKISKLSLLTALIMSGNSYAVDLDRILQESRVNDHKINILYEDYMIASEATNELNSTYKPQVNLQGSADIMTLNNSDLRDYNSYLSSALNVNATYSLLDPTRPSREKLAELKEAIAYVSMIDYLNEQTVTVTQLYYDVLRNRDTMRVDEETKKAMQQQYNKIKHMADVGLRTLVDVAEVQAQLDQSEADLLSSQNSFESSLSRLYVYTGDYSLVPDDIKFEDFKKDYEDQNYNEWLEKLQQENTKIKLTKLNELYAKETIKLSNSEDDFKLGLTSNIGTTYNNERYDNHEYSASLGVSFSLPLYDGGTNHHKVKQAVHNYNRSSIETAHSYRQLEPQLKILFNELKSLDRTVTALEKSVSSSLYSYEAIESGYKIGTRDILDVLEANADYAVAQKNLYSAQYNYLAKQAEFKSLVENTYNL